MRRYLITSAMLLASCGPDAPGPVPADLLRPVPGWTGTTPRTEGKFALAASAEQAGRLRCNGQLLTVAEILQ